MVWSILLPPTSAQPIRRGRATRSPASASKLLRRAYGDASVLSEILGCQFVATQLPRVALPSGLAALFESLDRDPFAVNVGALRERFPGSAGAGSANGPKNTRHSWGWLAAG